MYEVFDHTADLGLRIRAEDLSTLFSEAGKALFSIIVDQYEDVKPTICKDYVIEGDDLSYVLFDWLNELLYTFESEHVLLGRFEVQLYEDKITARAFGEPVDPQRHQLSHEVKAITYHGLRVEQTEHGWLAEVIVDI